MTDRNSEPPIVEDIGSHYRREGENFWYVKRMDGPDYPLINLGPGPNPDPRPLGPGIADYEQRQREAGMDGVLEKIIKMFSK